LQDDDGEQSLVGRNRGRQCEAKTTGTIELACDTLMAIVDEARSSMIWATLGDGIFKMLVSPDVFAHLRKLSPSLDAAIAICA
jgi:hypothetical protein